MTSSPSELNHGPTEPNDSDDSRRTKTSGISGAQDQHSTDFIGEVSPRPVGRAIKKRFQVGERIADRYEILGQLGRGGFGAVYRAEDHDLNRPVAVKRSNGLRSFVAGHIHGEAKAIASLNHPNIIAIYDLITIGDSELLIVMECAEGVTLADHFANGPVSVEEAVDIAIQAALALQHAHSRQLVHSDLKPSNLFIAEDGRVRLLDFGLAVACFPDAAGSNTTGGTPGYMAPEQVRGESHLIDGRADIWSLGVVLFQLLTGCRPFVGSNGKAVLEATLHSDPPPIRQLRPEVDSELQRIVLRCLEKRRSDRYGSAGDLIDDLQAWRDGRPGTRESSAAKGPLVKAVPLDSSSRFRSKGLLPYTEQDAEWYQSLVPGPRDRSGVPESILFWQHWAESDDADANSPVGVLYGPSGSGKTSFVRAGLIRNFDPTICCVYVECRPGDLGGRISRIIQSRIQPSSTGSSLRDLLTMIRTDDSTRRGFRKLLIILDQFEAWAQRASLEERRDFAEALRQCDGKQIRALVVTRDDFWMGVTELLRWLELPIQEGRNIASVDLLDPPHARRILESIGRGSAMLPPEPQPLTTQQQQFIQQAVEELTVGGAVIAVHLVIFAQMARLRQWTPRSLRSSGGVTGACSLYFQELFGGPSIRSSRSPEYRRIASAVLPILSSLLPDDDNPVLDTVRSETELLEDVRQAKCEHIFKDCLRALCEELRIITIVDEDSSVDAAEQESPLAAEQGSSKPEETIELRYRLSHDFLIEPIREWIDRARKRTWRGRQLARLAEVSDAWSRRPSRVHMPGLLEYCSLVAASRLGGCSDRDSAFISAATKHHSGASRSPSSRWSPFWA